MKRALFRKAAFGAIFLCAPRMAEAAPHEHASATLVYNAPNTCPARGELERAVAERLGYTPFVEGADKVVRVTIALAPNGKRYRARIDVRTGGTPQGERDIPEEADCAEIVRASALMVALAVDPLADGRPVTEPQPPAPVSTPVAASATPAKTPAPEVPPRSPVHRTDDLRVYLQAGVTFSALRLPMAGTGAVVQFGLVMTGWSIAVEGRAEFPFSSLDVPITTNAPAGGSVTASLLSVVVAPCLEGKYYFGCPLLEAGVLRGTGGDVKTPKQDASPILSAGARLGLQLATSDRFVFRTYVEALAPLTRTTLVLNDAPAWTTPTLGLGLGFSVGRRF